MTKQLTPLLEALEILKQDIGKMYEDELIIVETALKALEIIKELLGLKVIELLPNDSDTRLFVECGNFKASINIPPKYIDLLKEVLNNAVEHF